MFWKMTGGLVMLIGVLDLHCYIELVHIHFRKNRSQLPDELP